MKKQRHSHSYHKYEHEHQYPNNILSGDQPPQVLNYQLAKLKQKNGISQLVSQHSQGIPLHKWILRPLVPTKNISMLSL